MKETKNLQICSSIERLGKATIEKMKPQKESLKAV